MTTRAPVGHLPALDGLRGVAIALVLVCHTSELWSEALRTAHPWLGAPLRVMALGWVGVDLFFVLSGFLITGILLDARGRAGAWRAFYARRVLRIFPLYYATLVGLLVVLPRTGIMRDVQALDALASVQGWYWTHAVNLLWAVHGKGAAPMQTGHFWSLAVEEQFYLVWPAVVLLATRRTLVGVCGALIVLGAVLRGSLAWAGNPDAAVAFTLCRADALAVGALLAVAARHPSAWRLVAAWSRRMGPWLGLLTLAWLWQPTARAVGIVQVSVGYTLLALAGAATLVWATTVGSESARGGWLRARPLMALGRVSYGLYVLHYPLFGLVRRFRAVHALEATVGGTIAETVILLAVAYGVAALSFRVLEQPFLRLKRFVPMPAAGAPLASNTTIRAAVA